MAYSKEDKTVINIPVKPGGDIEPQNQVVPAPSLSQANSSILNCINSSFSFSDTICCSSFFILEIVFGIIGLFVGYAITTLLYKCCKNDLGLAENAIMGLPFFGMAFFMACGSYLWGKSVDSAMAWEQKTARRRAPGLIPACQDFFSSCCPRLMQTKDEEEMSEDSEPLVTINIS